MMIQKDATMCDTARTVHYAHMTRINGTAALTSAYLLSIMLGATTASLFALGKYFGLIDWSWLWILFPVWGTLAILFTVSILLALWVLSFVIRHH